jgi:hypothetical protein
LWGHYQGVEASRRWRLLERINQGSEPTRPTAIRIAAILSILALDPPHVFWSLLYNQPSFQSNRSPTAQKAQVLSPSKLTVDQHHSPLL